MVREVVSAVSNALYNEFGTDYRIYVDSIEQNLNRPSFLIRPLRSSVSERLMGRSQVSVPLLILYFPTRPGQYLECCDVGDRLTNCLKYPGYDDVLYRGTNIKFDIIDDVLNFRITYNFFTVTQETNVEDNTIGEFESSVNAARKDDM